MERAQLRGGYFSWRGHSCGVEDTILKTTTLLSGRRFDQVNIVLTRSIFPEDDVVGSKLAISISVSLDTTLSKHIGAHGTCCLL